jgi:hypothetical protein
MFVDSISYSDGDDESTCPTPPPPHCSQIQSSMGEGDAQLTGHHQHAPNDADDATPCEDTGPYPDSSISQQFVRLHGRGESMTPSEASVPAPVYYVQSTGYWGQLVPPKIRHLLISPQTLWQSCSNWIQGLPDKSSPEWRDLEAETKSLVGFGGGDAGWRVDVRHEFHP